MEATIHFVTRPQMSQIITSSLYYWSLRLALVQCEGTLQEHEDPEMGISRGHLMGWLLQCVCVCVALG